MYAEGEWWIRQAILQAVAEQRRIARVSQALAGTIHRIRRCSAALREDLGRPPTVEEIADATNPSEEQVAETLSGSRSYFTMDVPLTPGSGNDLLDILEDAARDGTNASRSDRQVSSSMDDVYGSLTQREAKILKPYFGLEDQDAKTLEEIGGLLRTMREHVRRIKERALARLRHMSWVVS